MEIATPVQLASFGTMPQSPTKYLAAKPRLQSKDQQELAVLALIKMAADNPEAASAQMDTLERAAMTARAA